MDAAKVIRCLAWFTPRLPYSIKIVDSGAKKEKPPRVEGPLFPGLLCAANTGLDHTFQRQ